DGLAGSEEDNSGDDQENVQDVQPQVPQLRRSSRDRVPSSRYPTSTYITVTENGEPESFQEAVSHKESTHWKAAMDEEMASLMANGTYDLVKLPTSKKALKNKWVYKLKSGTGSQVTYKARLVVKGYGQQKGIDFEEIFSPVVKMSSIRIALALVASLGLHMEQMDVKTAFLHGDLEEDIYMEQPEGYEVKGKEKLVCKLKKSLYGLKQAPRQWYKKFDSFMIQNGYTRTDADPCVYIRREGESFIILLLYVDDMIIIGQDMSKIVGLKKELGKAFSMKDLGAAKQILGIKIERDKEAENVYLSQKKYVENVLKKFNMSKKKFVSTPLAKHHILSALQS
nr:hypothetical protein [Serratia marcescens]